MLTKAKKIDDKVWLPGHGNTEADVMLICSHPTHEDLSPKVGGVMLEGAFADEVSAALHAVGIHEDRCWFTSMVKFGIGNKDKPNAAQIALCAAELDEEIKEIKPKLIITLGSEIFKRIMKKNIAQGDYVGEVIESPYGSVLANFSPAQIYAVDPKLRNQFVENFFIAKRFIDGNLKYEEYSYIVVNDAATNRKILQHYIDKGEFLIGYDAEWKGKFMVDEKMYTFQYSLEKNKAIILPIFNKETNEENLELLRSMDVIFDHPKVKRVGWNIRADDKRLKLKGVNLREETLAFDGMKAIAFFDSRWPKGLESGIRRFTNYKPYYTRFYDVLRTHKLKKDEMSEVMFKDAKAFYDYCAGDAVSHREACKRMMEEFSNYAKPEVIRYYYDTYLPLTNYLAEMELQGIPIDMECLEKLTEQYTRCYDALNAHLMKLTKDKGFDDTTYKTQKLLGKTEEEIEAAGIYPTFNPRSSHDKVRLFFGVLKLTPAYYVKKAKTRPRSWYDKQKPITKAQYKPSANSKCVASLKFELTHELEKPENKDNEELKNKLEIVSTYLNLARVGVFAHKFLSKKGVELLEENETIEEEKATLPEAADEAADEGDGSSPLKSSYWAALANDKRIHADFYECLDNFRSSSRPNVQNPASKVLSHIGGIFKSQSMEAPVNIRNIFYSGSKDYYFAEVDVAGADLAIAAFLSGDPAYKNDILKGGFHTTKMHDYFKDKTLTKDDYSKYVTAKSITFRVAYTAGLMSAALPIQAEIFSENGDYVPIEIIEYALKTWEKYKTYMEYRERCQRQVYEEQCIDNARGMRFQFEYTDNNAIKAGWANQALAYPIASELALFMWDISVKLKEQLKKDKTWMKYIYPVNVVHDANYWLIHKDTLKDNYFPEVAKNYFTKEVKIATGDNLGMEMVVSDCWKGKTKIFSNETKWNFQKKVWEWSH